VSLIYQSFSLSPRRVKNKCFLDPRQCALGLDYPVLPVCVLYRLQQVGEAALPELCWENRLGNGCHVNEVRQDLWVLVSSSNVSGLT